MNGIQITLCIGLCLVICWVLGTMAADWWWALKNRGRTILKLGTASWYHSAAITEPGEPFTALSTHWPEGEIVRVYNSAGTYVDVRVVAPAKPFKNTERVLIYLDRAAFVKIAPLGVTYLHVQTERVATAQERACYRQAEKAGALE